MEQLLGVVESAILSKVIFSDDSQIQNSCTRKTLLELYPLVSPGLRDSPVLKLYNDMVWTFMAQLRVFKYFLVISKVTLILN